MGESIICIGREYGSGGREIGEKLAGRLNVSCYDKLLLKQAAEKSGMSYSAMERIDEKLPRVSISGNAFADAAVMMHNFYFDDGQTVNSIRETVKELASRQSCVIIGRCASAFLKDYPVLSVFIYANPDDCIQRIMKRNAISKKEAENRYKHINRMRRQYFDFYSDTKWGRTESYDIMLSSSALGIEGCVDMIEKSISLKMGESCHE